MVVTATRTPVEAFKANANISVITKKEIEERHYQDLSEALRMVPGVYIGNYSVAGYDNSNNLKINGGRALDFLDRIKDFLIIVNMH